VRRAGQIDDALRRQVTRARAHDPEAFAELVRAHQHAIYAFILGIVRNREDASDLTQEVWLKVAQHLDSLREAEDFTPWLYRIARNSCLDFLRARKSRPDEIGTIAHEGDDGPLELPDRHGEGPEQHALALDEQYTVWETLGRLSEQDRTALFLREYLEFPYTDIARTLGISPNAAEVRVFRARVRFRQQFARVEDAVGECEVSALQLSRLIDRLEPAARGLTAPVPASLQRHVRACLHCHARLEAMQVGRRLYRRLGLVSAPEGLFLSIITRLHLVLGSAGAGEATVAAGSAGAADGRSTGPLGALAGGIGAKAAAIILALTAGAGVASHEGVANMPHHIDGALPMAVAEAPASAQLAQSVIASSAGTSTGSDDPPPSPLATTSDVGTQASTPPLEPPAPSAGGLVAASAATAGEQVEPPVQTSTLLALLTGHASSDAAAATLAAASADKVQALHDDGAQREAAAVEESGRGDEGAAHGQSAAAEGIDDSQPGRPGQDEANAIGRLDESDGADAGEQVAGVDLNTAGGEESSGKGHVYDRGDNNGTVTGGSKNDGGRGHAAVE
jgi:RNA polymerase sigma-70 factor (ECF subfamily)